PSNRTRSRRPSAACTARTTTFRRRRSRSSPPRAKRTCAITSRRRATTAARRSSSRRTDGEPLDDAMKTVIAVDAMGGDHGPSVTVPACFDFLSTHPDSELLLVGLKDALDRELARHHGADATRLQVITATQVVGMDEDVRTAIRTKKDSSMRVAIDLVKSGRAQACVSAGNTGALMATARFVLKTLPGVDRPAIIASIPTTSGKSVRVLDLGANVDSKPEHLLQFA